MNHSFVLRVLIESRLSTKQEFDIGSFIVDMSDVLVILPTLGDRLDTLRETLLSVQIQESDVDLRLVLVSPVSATSARGLGKEFGATLVDDPGVGISAAINAGITSREGERYYAWIGDDDLFRPGGLKTLLNLIESDPEAVVAYGGCEYIDAQGKILTRSRAGKFAQFLLPWGPDLIPHPGSMINLDALEFIGGFDTNLKYALDLDVFLKLQRCGRFLSTRTVVSAFRWHTESLTVSNRLSSSRESEAVKRRCLPVVLRPISFLWSYPVRWASSFAARQVSSRA